MQTRNPIARTEGLVVQNLVDETLIYDLENNTAHCLNSTAAFVWSVCDGESSIADIEKMTRKKFGQAVGEDFVWLALDSFKQADLLMNSETIKPNFGALSRRQMIRKVGLATMIAIPLVSSLTTPTAAQAASAVSCTDNTLCGSPNTCTVACPNCIGNGICTAGAGNCSNIGGSCSATGTCQNVAGNIVCSVDAATPCAVVGTPCTVSGTCFGTGVCR